MNKILGTLALLALTLLPPGLSARAQTNAAAYDQDLIAQARAAAAEFPPTNWVLPILVSNSPPFDLMGQYYSLQHADWPPLPFPPWQNVNAWCLDPTRQIWVYDDRDLDFSALDDSPAADASRSSRPNGRTFSPWDGSGVTPEGFLIPTNGLWLEITTLTNALVYLNLHNATNFVYELWTKTNLYQTNWAIESEIFPGTNTVVEPFTLPQSGRSNLFIWARDWTGITEGSNTVPDWWYFEYYGSSVFPNGDGSLTLSDSNLDAAGNPLLQDYNAGMDPNVVQFSLQFTNSVVNASPAYGSITILAGVPYATALLVNDTNLADAVWQPYTSTNVTVPLSSGNGLYNVLVGLRGLPAASHPTWLPTQLQLNAIAPTFIVTNPAVSTVSVPVIQLQGYVSESLARLTWDVSNAAGLLTNQTGYWQPAFYDTNRLAFTTNAFQCCDVPLTNGLNQVTLHATDLAGNVTTTHYNFTLDYSGDHTAPVLTPVWPTNGALIAGSNVTLQATMDDLTATATATLGSNSVAGLIERNGNVWFNNLPLNPGTNSITLTATDAAGNVSTTNFNVIESAASFSINPLSPLNQPFVTVTGTVGDATDSVTVNGVAATVSGGSWEADHVPVSPSGLAQLNAQVTDSAGNSLGAQTLNQPQPAMMGLMSYASHRRDSFTLLDWTYGYPYEFSYLLQLEDVAEWSAIAGGTNYYAETDTDPDDSPLNFTTSYPAGENGVSVPWENASFSASPAGLASPTQFNWHEYQNHTETQVMIEPSGQVPTGGTALYLVSVAALALPTPAVTSFYQDYGFRKTAKFPIYSSMRPRRAPLRSCSMKLVE